MRFFSKENLALRVLTVTFSGNILLFFLKLTAGIIGHSGAMVSDSIHSLADVLCTLIVLIGVALSKRQSDVCHPYGHDRLECAAAIILAVILFLTGLGIGGAALEALGHSSADATPPSLLALCAAGFSIFCKEAMYQYTRRAANALASPALLADAWHHRTDALSSVGSLAGIAGSRMGFAFLDPLASIVICLFILKIAADIFRDSLQKMVDHSCSQEVMEHLRQIIESHPRVKCIPTLKTRLFGSKIYVDVIIAIDRNSTLLQAFQIAREVHDSVEMKFSNVKHCAVCVQPDFSPVRQQALGEDATEKDI